MGGWRMITIFKNVYDHVHPIYREHTIILEMIRNGRYKDKIHRIRLEQDKNERVRLKNFLPSICWSGKFEQRYDKQIIEHSGLVVLDFDHIGMLEEKRAIIEQDEYTYACFVSPSGDGLKVLIKIPPVIKEHSAHYLALLEKYPELDPTSKNVSRVCFISYDPSIYINDNSTVWTKKVVETKKEQQQSVPQVTDYKKIDVLCGMIRNSIDGEKHHNLIRASRLAGGFIAGGMIEETEAVRALEIEINRKGIIDFKSAQKAICDGIEYGKQAPIQQDNITKRIQQAKDEDIIIEEEPATDVIYLDTVRDNILYSFRTGSSRGETTHFKKIDEVFRWKRGELTVMHGLFNHGKSEMLMQLCLMKAVKDGHKWGVFSPENYPAEEFYKALIHSFIGKSTEKHHHNQMNEAELNYGMDFIREHFFFMFPEIHDPTPEYINKRFREMIIKHNIDGCVIDPYNQLDTDISKKGGKEHLYLSSFLSMEKKFAVDHNVFFVIVTHPNAGVELSGNDYKLPKPYSLSGGAMWGNKSDNILVTHRPNFSDKDDGSVIFASQKIKKQKLNGIPGEVHLVFDRMKARYYDDSGNPLENDTSQVAINYYETDDNVPF